MPHLAVIVLLRGLLALCEVLLALKLLLLLELRFALTRLEDALALQPFGFLLLLEHLVLADLHLHALVPVLQLQLPAALLLD